MNLIKVGVAILGLVVLLVIFSTAIGIDFAGYLTKPVFPTKIGSFVANCKTVVPNGFDFVFFKTEPMRCNYETKEGVDFNTCYREYFESANHGLVLVEDTCLPEK